MTGMSSSSRPAAPRFRPRSSRAAAVRFIRRFGRSAPVGRRVTSRQRVVLSSYSRRMPSRSNCTPRLQDARRADAWATAPRSQSGSLPRPWRNADRPSAGFPCGCGSETAPPGASAIKSIHVQCLECCGRSPGRRRMSSCSTERGHQAMHCCEKRARGHATVSGTPSPTFSSSTAQPSAGTSSTFRLSNLNGDRSRICLFMSLIFSSRRIPDHLFAEPIQHFASP